MTDPPSLTWKQIRALGPCSNELAAVHRQIEAKFPDYRSRALTLQDAANAGVSLDNLIWIAGRSDERRARLFAADCAARVSHLLTDERSREAIRLARLFARGEVGLDRLSAALPAAGAAAGAAKAAVWEAAKAAGVPIWDVAGAAAQAAWAAWAAARAAWVPAWAATRAAWSAARAAAGDAAWAATSAAWSAARAAAGDAAWAARDAEQRWQRQRLLDWFSDSEPEDWPMPIRFSPMATRFRSE